MEDDKNLQIELDSYDDNSLEMNYDIDRRVI